MHKLALYARTVRFLTWRQLAFRIVRRLQGPARPRRQNSIEASTANQTAMAETIVGWGPGDESGRIRAADQICDASFTFLNDTRSLPQIDWRHRYVSHLWTYNLHYFAYAIDLAWAARLTGSSHYPSRFLQLAGDWIEQTRGGEGDGWQPYPTSVRIMNWSYALLLLGDRLRAEDREMLLRSLYDQIAVLRRRIEYQILGNHLLKNLVAVVVGSLMFDGPKARRWGSWAAARLQSELRVQVLPDGTHFERSPMYHAIALGDLLECTQLLRACGGSAALPMVPVVTKMAAAYGTLCRPNGRLHLFNDSAHGIAPGKERLDRLAISLTGDPLTFPTGELVLPESGYYGFRDGRTEDRILIDCGAVGPDFQPGHAHCDALSFELDVSGRPVIVDSGVCGYDGDPYREYVRSTRAHNTVMLNGKEQSEVWGTFRVARRISRLSASQSLQNGVYRFAGQYSPYHDKSAIHRRTIVGDATGWLVTDHVSAKSIDRLESFIHFHPDFVVEIADGTIVATSGPQRITIEPFGVDEIVLMRGRADPIQGWYCPAFGRAVPNDAVMMSRRDGEQPFGYRISGG
jgi:uncharacterized heparinase superfamily protein